MKENVRSYTWELFLFITIIHFVVNVLLLDHGIDDILEMAHVGFITSLSRCLFCHTCDKLVLTSNVFVP